MPCRSLLWFLQLLLQPIAGAIFAGWLGLPLLISSGLALLITGMVGFHTWESGMSEAGNGWRISTILMLAVTLGFTLLAFFALAN